MNDRFDPRQITRLGIFASAAGIVPGLIGLSVLAGWALHVVALLTWGAGTPMAPNAAGCTVLASISLWSLRREDGLNFWVAKRLAANIAAGIIALVGLLTLAEHLFDLNLGIDRFLLISAPSPEIAAERVLMSPIAAGFFLLFGCALLGINWRTRRGDWPAQFLTIGAMAGAAFGLFGLILGPGVSATTLALPAVISYFLLACGILCSRPTWAVGGFLIKQGQGASLVRRTVPAALLVMSIIGLSISRALLAESHFTWVEVSVLGVFCITLLAGLIVWLAFLVERGDDERKKVAEAAGLNEEQLNRLLNRIDEPQEEKLIRRRVKAGFAVAVLLTILLSALSWRASQQAAADADWVAHTHQVSTTLESTLRHLDDVETGGRGFALTGHEPFLGPYGDGKFAVDRDLQALRHLTTDDPDQQRRVDLLVQQANARIAASSDLVAFRRGSGSIPTITQLEQGRELMDAVRGTVEQMEAEENRLLEERSRRALVAQRFNTSAMGLGLILGVTFLSVAGITVSREIGVSAKARAQINALNADLELRVEQRTAALQSEIAARTSTDAKLRASEEMFRALLDGIKDYAVYMLDVEGRLMSWNFGAARIKGYLAEEIIGKDFSCFYTETDRSLGVPQESLKKAAQTGRFEGGGWRLRKDGSKFWADAVITPVYEANGSLRGYSKIVRDVTERKQSEDELKKQSTLLDLAHDAILVRDLQSRVVFWNRGAQNIYGWSEGEATGKVTHEFLQTKFPQPLTTIEATLASKGDWEGELRHTTRYGTEVIVASRWSLQRDEQGLPAAILEINRDITDRKRAEAALGDSEGRLAGIIASAMDSIITVDDEQRIVLFNCAAEKMFRCPAEEAIGQPITRFIPERFHASHAEHIRTFGKTGVTTRAMGPTDVLWALRADGQEFQIEASISHVVTGGKKLFTVILRDVTERKRSEEIRERLAAVVDSTDDAIISKDLNGTINAWNHGAEKVFGYLSAESLGKPMLMLFPPERVGEEADILARIQKGESVEHFETERLRKDGTKIIVSVTISPIRDSKGAIVGASKIARDITDRTAKAEALRESEERFRLFIEHAPAALAMFDREMRYLHESRRWRADFGLGDRDIRGVSHYEIFPEVPERWKEIHRHALAGEVLRAENDRFERPDGNVQWLRWEVRPWRDRTGGIAGIVVFSEDVTERNRSQEALVDSEERLRLAIDGARLGTWHWKLDSDELDASPLSFALFGLPADTKFNFARFLAAVHPDDRSSVQEAVRRSLAGESEYDIEYRTIWPDGTERWIAAKGRVYKNAGGENTHMGGILFDVTERHKAENALHESEERFQVMANGIPQLAWIAEADGHIFWYNQRWYEYTGTSPEQMRGWGWQSVHDPKLLPTVLDRWKDSIANGSAFEMEFPLRAADGHFGAFLTRVMPLKDSDGRVVRWFGTNTDISERKQAEERLAGLARELSHRAEELVRSREALEAQTTMFKLVLASMGEGLIAADESGRFLIFNDAAHSLMGRGPEDLPKEQWTQHYKVFLPDGITPYPPDRLPLVRALHGESVQVELIVEQPEALPGRYMEVTARPLRNARGDLCGGVAVLHDVTERKQSERELARQAEELRRSRQDLETQTLMLQSVLDSMVEGLIVADEQGKFIIWNPAAKRIVGLAAANLSPEQWSLHYGAYLPDTFTPFPTEQNPLVRAIRGEVCSAEMFFRNSELQDGVYIESNGAPLRDKNGAVRGGVVAFRDITQQKVAEQEIRKLNENLELRIAERTAQLEAANHELEAFTYSVSHDLRAPIRHISSFSKILSEDFGAAMDPEARRLLERIANGTRRMTLLVDGLLGLARIGPQSLKLSPTEMNAVVDGAISVLQPQCEGRDVEWRIAKLPALECDPILMGQVFQNLIGNALKYSGRCIKAVIEIDSIQQAGNPPVIFVRDNGAGFSMQYADKLFGVFQRMHKDSEFEGSGVGLATVHRIIQKHGGSIWANAEVDRGATFYFTVREKAPIETIQGTTKNGVPEHVHDDRS